MSKYFFIKRNKTLSRNTTPPSALGFVVRACYKSLAADVTVTSINRHRELWTMANCIVQRAIEEGRTAADS